MTTNIAVAAQGAHPTPTILFVLKSTLPAETESRLDRIHCSASMAHEYKDEFRLISAIA